MKKPQTPEEADQLADGAIAAALHATRCAANSSLSNYSPGALVFGRDMYLDVPLIADILTLTQARQAKIDKRLLRVNASRSHHDYAVGEQVYVVRPHDSRDKATLLYDGPFPIVRVHTNNTVTLQRKPHQFQRLTIRRIKPECGNK